MRHASVAALMVGLVVSTLAVSATGSALADANESPGAPLAFRSITAGGAHSCALLPTGRVKCWGEGDSGQLGQGSIDDLGDNPGEMAGLVPVNLGVGRTATAVSAGGTHTCALLDDGTVKCWGQGSSGRLGQGTTVDLGNNVGEMAALPAVDLGAGRSATAVTAGEDHTCALLDDGTVKCWGEGSSGQLGQDSTSDLGDSLDEVAALAPVNLGFGRTATAVSAGNSYTCALLDDATVKCWGVNASGQLGQDSVDTLGNSAGEMAALSPVNLGIGRTATAVTAGTSHTCALLDDATVKCWGLGGQLGQDGTATLGNAAGEMAALPPINLGVGRTATAVSAGLSHTCAVLDDATVKCWGGGQFGRLGQDSAATLGDSAGEMAAIPPVNVGVGRTAMSVTAGGMHTCAVLDDSTVKCWGAGTDGQLGQNGAENLGDSVGEMGALAPVDLGQPLTLYLTADQRRVRPGDTIDYQLTIINLTPFVLTGVTIDDTDVPGCEQVVPDLAGTSGYSFECSHLATPADFPALTHTVTVDTDQTGPVASNVLGVAVGFPTVATTITAGGQHNCIVVQNATVECWGSGSSGRLGDDSTASLGDGEGETENLAPVDLGAGRTALAVAAGAEHACALLDDATVKCWGEGGSGQLGQGTTADLGNSAGEMAALVPVNLGDGRTAVAVTAGASHSCALLEDATVKCWGRGFEGQLGQDTNLALGDQSGEMAALSPVSLGAGRTATSIAAGDNHTCALLDDATVKCWGFGFSGQLGQDSALNQGDSFGEMAGLPAIDLGPGRTATEIAAGAEHTCAILDTGNVKCWGNGDAGRLGQESELNLGDSPGDMAALDPIDLGVGRTATAISAGSRHTCALLDDQTVKCWGEGSDGQLGQGSTSDRGDAPGEMAALPAVDLGADHTPTVVAAGGDHTCVRLDAGLDRGRLKCWGRNESGQLGQGSTATLGDQPGEMAALAPIELGFDSPGLPAVTVVKVADQDTVDVGETIGYHVTVTNTGNIGLTGLSLVDGAAPDCDQVIPDLGVGEQHTVDCGYTATSADVGTYSNTATVESDQTGPIDSNRIDVTVTLLAQPDLTIKKASGSAVGDGIYNTDGADQTIGISRALNGRATVYVTVTNDGDVAAGFDIRRVGTHPGVTVRYFEGRSTRQITSAVNQRTYTTHTLDPGERATIRLEITIRLTAPPGATRNVIVRALEEGDPTPADTVRANVRIR